MFKNNPIFTMMLGLCSALAVTTTLENGIIMGISVTVVLILSNTIISLFGNVINDNIRIPAYILIISTLVTLIDVLLKKYIPSVSDSLGIYIPLIIVNCLILGRAINFASKNGVVKSIKDGFVMGGKYSLALIIISLVREILGSGSISIIDKLSQILGFKLIINLPKFSVFPNPFFVSSAGAFLTLGLILALLYKGDDKNELN